LGAGDFPWTTKLLARQRKFFLLTTIAKDWHELGKYSPKQDMGFLSASSAEEAEALADTEAVFDLIICSVVMEGGGESGVHLAEHIERSKRTNSTLLVSPYSRDLLRHVPGFDRQRHFLSNPFSVEELLRRVRDLLAG
jgi:DNA-binding response OmpR family regulator